MSALQLFQTARAAPSPPMAAAPSPTPSPSPSGLAPVGDALSWGEGVALALILMLGLLLTGLILLWNRRQSPHDSLVRSWLAIAFAFGLLLFTAASFTLEDAILRSTLIGAVAASVGAAVSHYFASKASGEARQDLLAAAAGTETVPNLIGLTAEKVKTVMSTTSLKLEEGGLIEQASVTDVVTSQDPTAGASVARGSSIRVRFSAPPEGALDSPDTVGGLPGEAEPQSR